MKYFILTLVLLSFCFSGCFYLSSNSGYDYDHQYDDRYYSYLKENETLVKSRFHYVVSHDSDCCYIKRTFFPETKQITAEERFLDENLSVLDGHVIYWYDNGRVKSQGKYEKSKKSGFWEFYNFPSGLLHSKGMYNKGKKEDIWSYYDIKGRKYLEASYINDEFDGDFILYDSLQNIETKGFYLEDKFVVTDGKQLIDETPFKTKVVDESPYLKSCEHIQDKEERGACSDKDLLTYIYSNLTYPEFARINDIEGRVIVQFNVSNTGEIEDVVVPSGVCQDMKDECLRIMENMPRWNPGIQDGSPVKVKYTLPVKFKLEG